MHRSWLSLHASHQLVLLQLLLLLLVVLREPQQQQQVQRSLVPSGNSQAFIGRQGQ
jgi:hypothetical protein